MFSVITKLLAHVFVSFFFFAAVSGQFCSVSNVRELLSCLPSTSRIQCARVDNNDNATFYRIVISGSAECTSDAVYRLQIAGEPSK